MSTFLGRFEEIPFISVDRFDYENLRSKLFFLSHCHSDHMIGLSYSNGLPGPLYASKASTIFIRKQFPQFRTDIISLEIECPLEIQYEAENKKYTIIVTLLSARHCPGSVMFLFQTQTQNILYTGDFRITRTDLEKNYKILQEIPIDVAYIDSTFLNKHYKVFPSQINSINKIIEIISEWLEKDPENNVFLEIPAQYSCEYLFTEIYRKLKKKVYVEEKQWKKYIYFPNMDQCLSMNQEECQVFVIKPLEIGNFENRTKRIIKISALRWRDWKAEDPIFTNNFNYFCALYSSHCSLTEIKDFLEFIKPKQVKLNVIPSNEGEKLEIFKTLNEIYPQHSNESIKFSHEQEQGQENLNSIRTFECTSSPPRVKRKVLPKRVKF